MRVIQKISVSKEKKKFKKINNNLRFLLKKRFSWMKKYIKNKKTVIEIGSGNGLIKKFLSKKIITSDIFLHKNIDLFLDMNYCRLDKKFLKKVDVYIINHAIHHALNPFKTINQLNKYLKKDGLILINDPEISFFFKFFLFLCDHERWDLNIKNQNRKKFWYENNATARLLFGRKKIGDIFQKKFLISMNELSEFIVFLNCGGNSVNSPHIKLNNLFLNIVDKVDNLLVKLFPKIFALNRSVVLKKINI